MTNKMPRVFHFSLVQIHGHWHILDSNFKDAEASRQCSILPCVWLLMEAGQTQRQAHTKATSRFSIDGISVEGRLGLHSPKSCRILHR